jgi:hypothetical protein
MNFNTLFSGDTDTILGKTIKEIILRSETFIVYLDSNNVIQWSTDMHTQWGKKFGRIQNQVSYWESICNKLFSIKDAYDYKTLLAEAYGRMLDEGDDETATEIIELTVERIKKHGTELLRQQYILSSLITVIIIVFIATLSILTKDSITSNLGVSDNIYGIFLTSLFGGIGAFISTMVRAKNYKAEITLGKNVHRIDGFVRIVYGSIAGLVISLGIKSNLIFGFLEQTVQNHFAELFLGIISGASEVLLPNIIKQIEEKS